MTAEPDIERERDWAWFGAQLIALGSLTHGRALRRLAFKWIRIRRRAYWRALVAERMELGYRDLGGEG